MKNNGKQWKAITKQWKAMKNIEKPITTKTNNENPWKKKIAKTN